MENVCQIIKKQNKFMLAGKSISCTCQRRVERATLKPYTIFQKCKTCDASFSSYLFELKKRASEVPKLTWSILKIIPEYSKVSKTMSFMPTWKLYIATYHSQEEAEDHKGSELVSKYCHENKFLLANYKGNFNY